MATTRPGYLRNTSQPKQQTVPLARRAILGVSCAALAIVSVGCGDDATDDVATAAVDVAPATEATTEAAPTVATSDPPRTPAPTTDPPEPPPTTVKEVPDPSDELAEQIEVILTDVLAPGSIRWDANGIDLPATSAVAAVRIPDRDDLFVTAGENLDGTPVEPDAPFPVGNLTANLVQTVAFQLIDEGVLDPATTVDQWVPTLPNADRVTVQMLLDNETGWGDYGIIEPDPETADFGRAWSLREAMELRATVATVLDEPGTPTADNFMNEFVLGFVVEEVAGQPLADLVRDRVTAPTGLDDTELAGGPFPDDFRHGAFVFLDTAVDTSMFDPTAYVTWNQPTHSALSTPTDLLDLLDVWVSGELFTTDRTPAPNRFVPVLDDDGNPSYLVGSEVPFNAYCPCTEVDGELEASTIGRIPRNIGTAVIMFRYNDGISVVLHLNSNEAANVDDLEAAVTAIHELAARGR